MHKDSHKVALFFGLIFSSTVTMASDEQKESSKNKVSGGLAVMSQYIYRGGVENDNPTVQVGLEYADASGIYVGYWGSTLNYDAADASKDHGFEHDFYIGYAGSLSPDLSYRSHIVTYLYNDGGSVSSENGSQRRSTTGAEWVSNLSYQDFVLGVSIALANVSYANAGDTYLNLTHHYILPHDISFNSSLGVSLYQHGNDVMFSTERRLALNEIRLGLTKPIANTGFELSADYIYGVYDRAGNDLDHHVVLGLAYNF